MANTRMGDLLVQVVADNQGRMQLAKPMEGTVGSGAESIKRPAASCLEGEQRVGWALKLPTLGPPWMDSWTRRSSWGNSWHSGIWLCNG